MAKAYRVTVARTALDKVLDGITPEVAFALGSAAQYIKPEAAEARLLASEELVEPLESRSYVYTTRMGDMLTAAFKERIERMHPEPEPEPAPPEQPKPPEFTPNPEPAPMMPVMAMSCIGCGRPGCTTSQPKCSDCRMGDVKPPGVEVEF